MGAGEVKKGPIKVFVHLHFVTQRSRLSRMEPESPQRRVGPNVPVRTRKTALPEGTSQRTCHLTGWVKTGVTRTSGRSTPDSRRSRVFRGPSGERGDVSKSETGLWTKGSDEDGGPYYEVHGRDLTVFTITTIFLILGDKYVTHDTGPWNARNNVKREFQNISSSITRVHCLLLYLRSSPSHCVDSRVSIFQRVGPPYQSDGLRFTQEEW